ncbi:hypothetical protein VaNZ11_011373, partial [Volvox africanus]
LTIHYTIITRSSNSPQRLHSLVMPSSLCLLARWTAWSRQQSDTGCNLSLDRTTLPAPAVRTLRLPCSNGAVRAWAVAAASQILGGASAVVTGSKCGGRRIGRRQSRVVSTAAVSSQNLVSSNEDPSPSTSYSNQSYTLEDTRVLVETAMLAAVSGLAYLLSTILKLENSLGYFLPLPVVLAALRSGGGAGWRTMTATCFLLVGRAVMAAWHDDCVRAGVRGGGIHWVGILVRKGRKGEGVHRGRAWVRTGR